MPPLSDYYGLLEIGEGADPEEVKRAYRRLARLYHPDCNRGDARAGERFKAVQEAYAVLSDPARRRRYDRARRIGVTFGQPPGGDDRAADAHVNGSASHPAAAADVFATMFQRVGAEAGPSFGEVFAPFFEAAPARGADVAVHVRLSFEQALVGGHTEVRLPHARVVLAVPRGVRHGLRIRVQGRGAPSPETCGEAGDLYVTFRVEPSDRFRREGDDLHVVETVSALEAMLGATRTLVNAYGRRVKLPIPPGTQPGDRLRLRGQGVETADGRGDLYIEVQVAVPRDLTEEQRSTLAAAARRCGLL